MAKIKNLTNENLQLTYTNRRIQEENLQLKTSVHQNEETLRELSSGQERLQVELSGKTKDILQLNSEITRLKDTNDDLRDQVKELPRLREQVNEKDDKIKGKEIQQNSFCHHR
jgi:predicted  nucleic acid-binding Zn-ribbon protein